MCNFSLFFFNHNSNRYFHITSPHSEFQIVYMQYLRESMADLHNDVMYEGWGETSTTECIGNFKHEKIHQFDTQKD